MNELKWRYNKWDGEGEWRTECGFFRITKDAFAEKQSSENRPRVRLWKLWAKDKPVDHFSTLTGAKAQAHLIYNLYLDITNGELVLDK